MWKMIKDSCQGDDKISSKRLVMYIFVFISFGMIMIQALFTFIMMWKWAMNDTKFEILTVFPDTVWYMVFGLIGGIAGVNGATTVFKKKDTATPNESTEGR